MAERQTIIKYLALMAANWPNYHATAATPDLYTAILQDIPDDLVEAAAKQILSDVGEFHPTAGKWRQAALDLQFAELAIPTAQEAWGEVMDEIRRCSDYFRYTPEQGRKDPVWSTKIVEKSVSCVGYRTILESDNPEATRAHFYKTYDAIKGRWEANARTLPDVRRVSEQYTLAATNRMMLEAGE